MNLRHLIGRAALVGSLVGVAFAAPAAILAAPAHADVVLPAPSPRAQVTQTVGITRISVDYSSPGVKGRKIFGTLLSFGKLWRTGADAATILELSTDATIAGQKVAAGRYAVFMIPDAREWTVILNSDTSLRGERGYEEAKDVARIKVKPAKSPKRERLTFLFVDTTDEATRLDMEWEDVRISLPIQVDTHTLAAATIDAHMQAGWRPLANAARYLLDRNNLDKALGAIDASIAIQETWFNVWIKARIHAAKGDYKGAFPLAEKAYDLGNKDSYFFWKADVEAALKDWKAKL
jgi:hypothetical protein